MSRQKLVENVDYYLNEQGLFVFTAKYLSDRGFCCGSGCKHCPYPKEEFLKAKAKNRRGALGLF